MNLKDFACMTNFSQKCVVFDYNMKEIYRGDAPKLLNTKLEHQGQFIYPGRRKITFINTTELLPDYIIIQVI